MNASYEKRVFVCEGYVLSPGGRWSKCGKQGTVAAVDGNGVVLLPCCSNDAAAMVADDPGSPEENAKWLADEKDAEFRRQNPDRVISGPGALAVDLSRALDVGDDEIRSGGHSPFPRGY